MLEGDYITGSFYTYDILGNEKALVQTRYVRDDSSNVMSIYMTVGNTVNAGA